MSAAPGRRRTAPQRSKATAPVTAKGLARITAAFERFATKQQIDAGPRHDMHVALDEIVSNAVKHGRPGGRLHVELSVIGGAVFRAIVRDDGPPYNPLKTARPQLDQPLDERPIGGLGVVLVLTLMDSVRYRRSGRWNILSMRRRLER